MASAVLPPVFAVGFAAASVVMREQAGGYLLTAIVLSLAPAAFRYVVLQNPVIGF